ncbi:hypothetical protein M977_04310 [Buttiauxella gaviniae ATCC 51604]|uniref:Uncharacterized protein n=1 Tax=Buttiauxella gaviniae ATCC 51604 TaxID=1354253 RepID=A0A1B7HN38_9ENTR|nr:hypothetical protein [Buttiauxella gaviniae]OAT17064.1 hypothetical protein M977_04310 [Buttiauxella gaviniae ATCC 51604]
MSNDKIKAERAQSLVGAFFEVNDGMIEVISYNGNKRVLVRFVVSGYSTVTTMVNIRNRQVKDKHKPTICGVGYVGEGVLVKGDERRKLYMVWRNMLIRLTDNVNFPTYANVGVDPRWYCFAEFVHDVITLPGYERFMTEKDLSLDKDIRNPGQTKRYCKNNCMWISKAENTIQMVKEREQRKAPPVKVQQHTQAAISSIQW